MSTQKRDNRSQPIESTKREGVGCIPIPAHIARYVCAAAKGRTAPLMSILWSALAWAATKFLHSDHQFRQLVRPDPVADRRGSPPPPGAEPRGHGQASVSPVIHSAHFLSFRSRPYPSNLAARFNWAAKPRWTTGPGRPPPPGGKVRWQKRYVFPARRMRRG
jgi:hypothetical protein